MVFYKNLAIICLLLFSGINSFGQIYCSPSYPSGCTYGNRITNVQIGTINHSPPNCTTHNYTNLSTQIAAGVATPITVASQGFCGVGVAVDLNQDGDFDDANEMLALPGFNASYLVNYTLSITIPAATPNGNYRLRIYNRGGNSGGGAPQNSPCGVYDYGSWDDYTLIVYHLCATINAVTASPSQLCTSGTSSLTCNYTSSIPATVKWYYGNGTLAGTGSPFVTPTLTTTTTFYAAADNGSCDTPRVPVAVIVTPPVAAPLAITPADTTICEGKIVKIQTTRGITVDSVIANEDTFIVSRMPINGTSTNSVSELLYTSGELNIKGTITDFGFFKKSTNTSFNPGNVSVYMKNTTATTITNAASTAGYSLVYTGIWTNDNVFNSWNNIALTTPFDYLGSVNNLSILIVRSNAPSHPINAPKYRASNLTPNVRSSYYVSATPWISGASAMTTDTLRPDIKIKYKITPPVNWSPVTNLFKDANLTMPLSVTDTQSVVYAHPDATITYSVVSNLNGCLSTTSLSSNITVKDTVHVDVTDSVCSGSGYPFGTQILTAAGTYTESFQTVNTCDSIVTLHLSIRPYITNTVAVSICQGETYTFNGNTYTTSQAGLKDTFSTTGCDSIVTLNLTVNPNATPTFNAIPAICSGATAPILPTTSNNGITGTWNPATVDNVTTGTNTFTPTAGICATPVNVIVDVNNNTVPVFTAIAPFCSGAAAPALPTTSNNGITGTWNPAAVSNTTSGTYTFTPTAGLCATTTTMDITVNPIVTPTFTAIAPICNGSAAPVLPTTSNNGVTGTWNPAAVSNTATTTYTFTPTAGQCSPTTTLTVTVTPNVTPTFTIPTSICSGSTAPILPTTSNNGITGTWNPATVDHVTTGTYTFTPTAGICAIPVTVIVNVNNNTVPVFTAIAPFCSGAAAPALPTTSNNGITGTWNPAAVSNTTSGTYAFTPTAGSCATTTTMDITVNPIIAPTFTAIAPICNGSAAPVLPTTSNNGVTGTWNPAAVSNTATATYTFTPTAGQCSPNVAMTVTVTPNVTPTFTIPTSICSGSIAPVLPATSNNGITGTWNPATVDHVTTGTYTFTPTAGICAIPVTVIVNVNNNTVPVFTAIAPFCSGAAAPALPTTSNNGITGTWNPAAVSNTTSGTYAFTPTAGSCATTTTMDITVNPIIAPTFTAIAPICNGSAAPVLPTTSNNGVTGTWNPGVVSNTATATYTFTPTAGQCSPNVTMTVTVTPNVTPTFTIANSICSGAIAPILPTTSNNGITGTWNPAIVDNMTTGTYAFTPTAAICATPVTVTINVNNNTVPAFTAIAPICDGSMAPLLPTTSNNGITGTWNPSTVNNTTSGTYTFTPTAGLCATTTTMDITVNPVITPTFTAIAPICSGSTAPVLPATSNNGVAGIWNPAVVSNTATATYTFTPTAGQCSPNVTMTVTVTPNVTPTFTVANSICSGSVAPILPTTSNNGITGTWNPAIVDNMATGTYTFTPTAGICATPVTVTVNVNNNTIPVFTAIASFCSGAAAPALPTTSNNGITGTWNPAVVSNTTSGTYTFTPTAGLCASTTTMNITINPVITPTFTAVAPICNGSATPVLPTTSNNGVTGTWNPGVVSNTATTTYTFTPTAGQCSPNVTMTITVTPNVTPTFIIPTSICSGSVAPALPATSNNGITGTWNPSTVDNMTTGTYAFTPTAGICATIVTVTINVENNTTPIFNTIPAFCKNTAAPILPTTSLNGISGIWNPTIVSNTASGTYTFTPTAGLCAIVTTMNITVKEPSSHTDAITICDNQLPYTWNGVVGAVNGAVYTTNNVSNCDSVVTLQLTVLPPAVTQTIDTSGCGSVWYNNVLYTQGTTVSDTFINFLGCDSFIRIAHIIVYPNVPYPKVIDTLGCDVVTYEGNNYYDNTTLIDTFVNIHGCDSVVRYVKITVVKFELNLSVSPEEPYKGELIHLVSSANNNYTIDTWSPSAWFPDQKRAEYSIIANVDGVILIHGTDENGCTDTAEVSYKVKPLDYGVFVPNAFSPNGDNINDHFKPSFYMKRAYIITAFKVFNRYGQVVYSRYNDAAGWDGTMNNGQLAEMGNYHYFINIKFIDGKDLQFKGDVTLIK
jgi:gliding motility-associated-like protein